MGDLQRDWMANHISRKGLNTVVSKIKHEMKIASARKGKKGDLDPKFVKKEWKGFISAFAKLNKGHF